MIYTYNSRCLPNSSWSKHTIVSNYSITSTNIILHILICLLGTAKSWIFSLLKSYSRFSELGCTCFYFLCFCFHVFGNKSNEMFENTHILFSILCQNCFANSKITFWCLMKSGLILEKFLRKNSQKQYAKHIFFVFWKMNTENKNITKQALWVWHFFSLLPWRPACLWWLGFHIFFFLSAKKFFFSISN